MHRLGDDGNGDVESDQADHNGQPKQEWNDPVLVVTVHDHTGNPPSNTVSPKYSRQWTRKCALPGEERSKEDVHRKSEFPVESREGSPPGLLLCLHLRVGRAARGLLYFIVVTTRLLDVTCRMALVEVAVKSAGLEQLAGLLVRGSSGVDNVVRVGCTRAVVHVRMLVLVSNV